MYELKKGRPKDTAGRPDKEIRVYDCLDALGIEYERIDHDAFDTMADCKKTDELFGVGTVKNLLLCNSQKTEFYLLLMPADKKFKTKELSSQIGSARLSFASAEHMTELLDITPGSLSILGLMNDLDRDVTLLIDQDLLSDEYFGCHPCINTSTVKFKTSDMTEKLIPALKHTPKMVNLPKYEEEA